MVLPFTHRETRPGYCWRICPYSTEDTTDRLSDSQKRSHYTTSGWMIMSVKDGHDMVGFECRDPNCTYYLGMATESIMIPVNTMKLVNAATGEYTVVTTGYPSPLCSGSYFWEK